MLLYPEDLYEKLEFDKILELPNLLKIMAASSRAGRYDFGKILTVPSDLGRERVSSEGTINCALFPR